MIISIDKYKKTGGGSSGGSNTGGNSGSNVPTYYIPDDIRGIHDIMFKYSSNGAESFMTEVKNSIISNGFAKVTSTTLLLPETYPKLVYTSNGWQEVIDDNGNLLQTCVLPDDFFDYQKEICGNDFTKEQLINECLNYNKTYPDYDLIDQVFCNYDLENKSTDIRPYIKTITYATPNDYIPYHNNVAWHYSTYYGPEDRYSIYLDRIYCVAEYDINKCLMSYGGTAQTNSIHYQNNLFQCYNYSDLIDKYGDKIDADCYLITLHSNGPEYKDGKYICTSNSISHQQRYNYFTITNVNKCALFVDDDRDEIVNPTLKFIDGWSSSDYIGDLPYAYYNLEIEGGNYISFNGSTNAVFGKGLKNFTLTLNSNNSNSFYSYNHFTNASDLETITINFDETVPETLSSDFYFGEFFKNDYVTKITFNCPHKINFTNGEHATSLRVNCKKLKDIKGLESLAVNNNANNMFAECASLTSIHALDTSNATSMGSMFSGCTSLTSIPQLDTKNVKNMGGMFSGCTSLTSIPALDTSNATSMVGMFSGCTSLTSIPALDTSNVTSVSNMFYGCKSLSSIPQLDTRNVTTMEWMFTECSALTNIPLLDSSNVTRMNSMFSGCSSLTSIPALDTSKVTNMEFMFNNCASLTSIPQLDTKNVTSMSSMFSSCTSLTSIPALDTSNVTSMGSMFYCCSSLTYIPALDTSKVTYIGNMFGYENINTLTDLGGFKNLSISITSGFLDKCPNVTVESLMNVINNLATVSGKSLSFGSTNLNKLTADQIAIATAKGWTLTA